MLKKVLSLTLVCSILFSIFSPNKVIADSNLEEKTYIVISDDGMSTIVETAKLTEYEAETLKSEDDVCIVEEESFVYGLTNDDSSFSDKESHEKIAISKDSDECDSEWNFDMINSKILTVTPDITSDITSGSAIEVNSVTGSAIKVAVIDSGVDWSEDIDVYCRKDFISDDNDEMFVLFEDIYGHGTSVAGIIAAKDNNIGITGINPNVELYSARVLDENCMSPISRVIESIYWAIDQNVNIINISFGTRTDSEALHKAIQDAYHANILIVAAAGNKDIIEYPAAYDEVMSVGSVDTYGEVSEASAKGEELDIVAPGEQIRSTGAFDGTTVLSGTSMSAPHVTGVASVLWQIDPNVSNEFIRQLINYSANLYGDRDEYGNGLVDLGFALEQYDSFKELYTAGPETSNFSYNNELETNNSPIPIFEDIDYVTGSWVGTDHESFVTLLNVNLTMNELKILKLGAIYQDKVVSGLKGMDSYPLYHGYYLNDSNYLASYVYLTKVANNGGGTTTYNYAPTSMKNVFSSTQVNGVNYTSIDPLIKDQSYRKLFIWGMAIHQATDIFAHSAYTYNNTEGKYMRITHSPESNPAADNPNICASRINAAKQVAKNSLSHLSNNSDGWVIDFALSSTYYDGSYYLYKINTFATAINQSDSSLNKVDLVYNQTKYEIK